MFIVSIHLRSKTGNRRTSTEDMNDDQGVLDVDFLEFNELEKDYDDYAEDPNYDILLTRYRLLRCRFPY